MKWPWRKEPENRGTLTFLPEGNVILGLPHDFDCTEEQAFEIGEFLKDWQDHPGRPLVLGFPVDVIDKRPRTE